MPLNFVKMHANGDDFVLIDARGRDNPITRELAKALGDRRRGIGFNQLVVLGDCHESAAQLTFFNADGSSLNTCGSATRGAADLLMEESGATSVQLTTVPARRRSMASVAACSTARCGCCATAGR